jgi:hypothetical protein
LEQEADRHVVPRASVLFGARGAPRSAPFFRLPCRFAKKIAIDLAHARLHGDGPRDSVRTVTRSSQATGKPMTIRSWLPVAFAVVGALVVGSWAGSAHAQAAKEDLTTLEKSLTEQHDALSTSDCATACRALASIRRAADKICALDPGDRCVSGRAKADDATRRVRDACPECAIATAPSEPRREDRAMTKGGASQKATKASEDPGASPVSTPTAQSAPPSESKRGGCAGCTTTRGGPGDLAGGALAVLALALVVSRRRSRAQRASRT